MDRKVILIMLMLGAVLFFTCPCVMAGQREMSKEEILAIATAEVKAKGVNIEGAEVVYDEGNRLWAEAIGKMTVADDSPNFGILKKGFLQNYRTIYFDFKEPLKDIWVFIDKDTGEVLEVYTEQ